MPSERAGASYQIRLQSHDRNAREGLTELKGSRTDYQFLLFAGTRPDGLGLRAEGVLASSSWSPDSGETEVPDQTVRQAQIRLRYMMPSWTAEVSGRLGDARVKSAVEGRLGWVPFKGLVISGDGFWRGHDTDRESVGAHGAIGLYTGALSLVGELQYADVVPAPALSSDSAQRTVDTSIRAGFRTLPLSGHVAVVRRDPYLPLPYTELPAIPGFDSTEAATFLVADVSIKTSRALSLDGWYSNPTKGGPGDLQPVKHGRAQITFRSKFWRTFRSGAFDFKFQVAMESWSSGFAGLDEGGAPIEFPGATIYDIFLQFQLADLSGFWHYRDARRPASPYLPGVSYPDYVQTFGVKWAFLN
jgi:hypothetical protein